MKTKCSPVNFLCFGNAKIQHFYIIASFFAKKIYQTQYWNNWENGRNNEEDSANNPPLIGNKQEDSGNK
jgi:hypothetical protein